MQPSPLPGIPSHHHHLRLGHVSRVTHHTQIQLTDVAPGTPPVDSIPKPGALPDRRFNRDPESDRRSKSFKREKRYLGAGQVGSNTSHEFASSAALGTNGMGSGLGAWPAPASRATGYPRDPIAIANSARPAVHRPPTPDLLAVPHRSASPFKSAVPAWAAPLEKAMAEDELKKVTAVSCSATVKADSKNDGKGLTPPHLRNTSRLSNGVSRAPLCTSQVANPGASSTATDYATLAQRNDFVRDENLAWTLATTGLGIEDAKDVSILCHTCLLRMLIRYRDCISKPQ